MSMYELCKMQIEGGYYNREDMLNCLGVFLMTKQLTNQEYLELFNMINSKINDNSNGVEEIKGESNV